MKPPNYAYPQSPRHIKCLEDWDWCVCVKNAKIYDTNVRVGLRNDDSIRKHKYERGRVKQSPPDFEGALEAYNRAIELDPEYARAYNNRGTVYSRMYPPDHARALKDYTRAIELDPDFPDVYNNRGNAYTAIRSPTSEL